MKTFEQLLAESVSHLRNARRTMSGLTSHTGDVVAVLLLLNEFNKLEDHCRKFAHHQCEYQSTTTNNYYHHPSPPITIHHHHPSSSSITTHLLLL